MQEKIKEIIADELRVDKAEITAETDLVKDLEVDSLAAVQIMMAIEDEFDIEVPEEDSDQFRLVGDIFKYVEEKAGN